MNAQPDSVYSVSALMGEMRNLLETSYRSIWIEGEISGLASPASGHLYFSLKENDSLIRCAFFRNRRIGSEKPTEGMQVLVRGQISVYQSRGDLQLIVQHLEAAGEGALRRAFEALKRKLSSEGLFDNQWKQPLPPYPETIGVITSDTGAALHDIRVTLGRRFPLARVIIYPSLVQGESAVTSICQMLELASKRDEADVLILARGGGALEDLQAFNDEQVARAIHHCSIPLVTGVGHETDITIADLVADQRAATPTAAAELVTPLAAEISRGVGSQVQQLVRYTERRLNSLGQTIDYLSARLTHPQERLQRIQLQLASLTHQLLSVNGAVLRDRVYRIQYLRQRIALLSPENLLATSRARVAEQQRHLVQQTGFLLTTLRQRLQQHRTGLNLMNPAHTLARGYAILQDRDNRVVTSTLRVKTGQPLHATVADGSFEVVVGAGNDKSE